jgi:acetylornithine deacetylase/succinyl-diaminopimelate desuccinylase-like protein
MRTLDPAASIAFDGLVDERFDRWTDELRDFCSIPSETAHLPELERAASWVAERLDAAGAEVTVLTEEGIPPVVIGELGSGPRTLLAVQHYDVQPAAPLELWETGPFDPQVRDGRLYARGVCDDKGEFLHRVQAVEALRDASGDLPCRIRFIVEGEEESGSATLASLLAQRPELLEGNAALIEGGGVDEAGRPVLVCGVRGMLYLQLTARTIAFDGHSGMAQLLPNAAWRLVEALSTLRMPDGTITLDGFMDDVLAPTPAQLDHLRTIPFEEAEIKRIYGVTDFVGGHTGFAAQVQDTFQPTCNISGIVSGWTGPSVKTITPAEASAKLDLRLIQPGSAPDRTALARPPRPTRLHRCRDRRRPRRVSVLDPDRRSSGGCGGTRPRGNLRGAAFADDQRRWHRADVPGLHAAPAADGDAWRI